MILSRQIKNFYQSPFLPNPSKLQKRTKPETVLAPRKAAVDRRKVAIRGCNEPEGEKKTERRTFLTLEEAGLVEMSGLDTHERFLCRLTVGVPIFMLMSRESEIIEWHWSFRFKMFVDVYACMIYADIVTESTKSYFGARGMSHRGIERRKNLWLVFEG